MELQLLECPVLPDESVVTSASACGGGTQPEQAEDGPRSNSPDDEIRVRPFLFRTEEFWMDTDP